MGPRGGATGPQQCPITGSVGDAGSVCDPMERVDRACIGPISTVTADGSNAQCTMKRRKRPGRGGHPICISSELIVTAETSAHAQLVKSGSHGQNRSP